MSVCVFIAADCPLPEVRPTEDCSLHINIDTILLVIAFLISPFGLPKLAFWLLGKVQDLKYAIQDLVCG